jgi:hypothetical protein
MSEISGCTLVFGYNLKLRRADKNSGWLFYRAFEVEPGELLDSHSASTFRYVIVWFVSNDQTKRQANVNGYVYQYSCLGDGWAV